MKIRNLILGAIGALTLLSTGAAARAADVFALIAEENGNLDRLDISAGTYTNVGTISGDYEGLAYNAYENVIYGAVLPSGGTNTELVIVDGTSGTSTVIGSNNARLSVFTSMANGQLYGVGRDDFLYAVNPATGAATGVGATGLPSLSNIDFANSLASNGTALYYTLWISGSEGTLYRLNPSTGAATAVGPLLSSTGYVNNIIGSAYAGLTFTSGTLYGFTGGGSTYGISLTTGSATQLPSNGIHDIFGGVGVISTAATTIQLQDLSTGSQIVTDGTAWITGGNPPKMPMLSVQALDTVSGEKILWDLMINFTRPNDSTPIAGDRLHWTANGNTWNIYKLFGSSVLGGNATLTYTVEGNPPRTLTFQILGDNPAESEVLQSATSGITSPVYRVPVTDLQDCFTKLLDHESPNNNLLQFDPVSGEPLVTSDNAIGISQISNNNTKGDSLIGASGFWNWKNNVRLGWMSFQGRFSAAYGYPAALRANPAYRTFIKTVVNPKRVAAGLAPIVGYPAPQLTTAGLIGSAAPNQLLEDTLRGYDGYDGQLILGGIPITQNGQHPFPLHEFIPDENYLETLPDASLKALPADPNFWRRVQPSERPQPPAAGNPDFVSQVIAEP